MALADIKRLIGIAEKSSRLIVGLMSGTSLDGLDIALCRITGNGKGTKAELLKFITTPYSEAFIADIRQIFAKQNVNLEKLCLLNVLIANVHSDMILASLKKWSVPAKEIDLIASHGQTIYHAPKRLHKHSGYPNGTLQIGDGDHIAVKTGIITISDFRQKHVAIGGEGAPLALYGDSLLFSSDSENRVFLNIGGIANFTYLPANGHLKTVSTDIGPGNTLIDAVTKKYFGLPYDDGGQIALSGKCNKLLVDEMLANVFFKESFPKTTGPELFNLSFVEAAQKRVGAKEMLPQDLLATVTDFTVRTIVNALEPLNGAGLSIYISGGGCHNPAIVKSLENLLPNCNFRDFATLGIDPDAKEAVLFAILANECLAGNPLKLGNMPPITMGKISLPK